MSERGPADREAPHEDGSPSGSATAEDGGAASPASPAEARAARGYVRALLIVVGSLLAGVSVTSVVLDPTGLLGTGVVPPIEQTSRDEKATLYAALPAKPEVLILGSSRVWCLQPERLSRATGRAAFNFGVDTATSDDLLAILRYVGARGDRPRSILIGVEPEMFSAKRDRTSRLDYSRLLRPHAEPGAVEPMWKMTGELLLGATTLEGDRRALRRMIETRRPPRYLFAPSGWASWPRDDAARENGLFDQKRSIAESLAVTERMAGNFNQLASGRIASFRAFLALAKAQGIEVAAFIPPLHPRATPVLESTPLGVRYAETEALLAKLAAEGELRLLAPKRVTLDDFGGDAGEFYDHQHMTTANGERLLDWLLARLGGG